MKSVLPLMLFISACSVSVKEAAETEIPSQPEGIVGSPEYLSSPFVEAGDRLYIVGFQDGTFPDLGWHITGEMGGIWAHPIKLFDGLSAGLMMGDSMVCLPPAKDFTNYPVSSYMEYTPVDSILIGRTQFVPDGLSGMVVEYSVANMSDQEISFNLVVSAISDLRPVWLGERTGMTDYPDSLWFDSNLQAIIARDTGNEWYAVLGIEGSTSHISEYSCAPDSEGTGKTGSLEVPVTLAPGEAGSIPVILSGSHISLDKAIRTYNEIRENRSDLIISKSERYARIARTAQLTIPDKDLEETFRWLKYNTDWLIRDVEGVGRGLSAGIPDYPWWFGADSEYALQGALMTGRRDIVYETIDLIASISDSTNHNGRIVHEVSTNGAVFNPGNINETPQFASLIWKVFNWTGDDAFLEKYYPMVVSGLDWLMSARDLDGNGLPD